MQLEGYCGPRASPSPIWKPSVVLADLPLQDRYDLAPDLLSGARELRAFGSRRLPFTQLLELLGATDAQKVLQPVHELLDLADAFGKRMQKGFWLLLGYN